MFMGVYPQIAPLKRDGPDLAALGRAVGGDLHAVIIVVLIPLALRGVAYRPIGAAALLRRSLLVYGVGGIVAPFLGISSST